MKEEKNILLEEEEKNSSNTSNVLEISKHPTIYLRSI